MTRSRTAWLAGLAWAVGLTSASAQNEWPTYNRTLTSERFSPLAAIDTATVPGLKVVCSYDTGQETAFQSGLIEVDGALFATTEHDTVSLDPNTCKANWRVREEFKDSFLGAQRGVAVESGRVFRGAANGNVYAYDEKTGARLWTVSIADAHKGETVPSAPVAWQGLVFIGTAGGDNKGVKGRMYALDGATGRIVWELYLVPKADSDPARGPQAPGVPADIAATWQLPPGSEVTGGGSWTSYSLDPEAGLLYVPSGNPGPDFANGMRKGTNLFTGAVVVVDARTGAYRRHFSIAPSDFHDWDVSSPPTLIKSQGGTRIMAVAPKDGHLYAYDLASGRRLYRVPVTTQLNVDTPLTAAGVRFCPGSQGGAEWNGPAYDPPRDAIIVGQVDWCSTVHLDPESATSSVADGQPWTGSSQDGFGKQDDPSMWAGWIVSSDAETGMQRWKFRTPNPVLAAVTPTAGDVVFCGDMGGNIYALRADTGAALWSMKLDGAVSGGIITYDTGAGQKVAVSAGMTSKIWPTPKVTAKIYVLGLP